MWFRKVLKLPKGLEQLFEVCCGPQRFVKVYVLKDPGGFFQRLLEGKRENRNATEEVIVK